MRLLAINLFGLAVLTGGSLAGFAQGAPASGTTAPTGSGVSVPEPASLALLVSALGGLSFVVARSKRKSPPQPGNKQPDA